MANTSEALNLPQALADIDGQSQSAQGQEQSSAERLINQQFQQQLNFALQRTLDMEMQLYTYYSALKERFVLDSLCYRHSQEDIAIEYGSKKRHRCSYDLTTDNDTIGSITLTRKDRFTQDELNAIEHSTLSLAYPLRNAIRFRQAMKSAMTDPLTGAGNRFALEEILKQELESTKRFNRQFSIAMIDLDRFKNINDQYGHTAGDAVLKTVAQTIQINSRATDRFFRYGGEEFVFVMPTTDNAGALIISERLRAMIAGLSCVVDGKEIPITMSIGMTTVIKGDDIRSILKRADRAVYQAKHLGRNRVVNAPE